MNSVDSFYKNTIVAKVDYSSWNFNSMELGIMARCNMADSSWELYDLPQLISMTPVTTLEKQERKQVFIFLLFFFEEFFRLFVAESKHLKDLIWRLLSVWQMFGQSDCTVCSKMIHYSCKWETSTSSSYVREIL